MKLGYTLLTLLFLAGCIAKPRGEYYLAEHELGVSRSGTCDLNGNKTLLKIPLKEGTFFQAQLAPHSNSGLELSVYLSIQPGKSVRLGSHHLTITANDGLPFTITVDEWSSLKLTGSSIVQKSNNVEYESTKLVGNKHIISKSAFEYLLVQFPSIQISGTDIDLPPAKFSQKSGDIQWFPALNC